MKKPLSQKKVRLEARELSWRIRRYKALQRLIGSYAVRRRDTLTPSELEDLNRALVESEALAVRQSGGKITTVPYRYVGEVLELAIEKIGGLDYFRSLRPNQRYLVLSVWLRERGMPIPSLSSFSKYFNKSMS